MAQIGCIEILLIFLTLLFLCFFHRKLNKNSAIIHWPLLGMLPELASHRANVWDYATQVLKQTGWTLVFKGPWLLNMDFVVTSDPKNLHHILIKNSANYPKGLDFRDCLDLLGDGIFSSDFETWRNQRRIMLAITQKAKFQELLETTIQVKIVKGLLPILEHVSNKGLEVDLQDVFKRFSFDKICSLVLGTDPEYLSVDFPSATYLQALEHMEEAALQRYIQPKRWWKFKRFLRIGDEKRLSEGMMYFDSLLYSCISSKWEMLKSPRTVKSTDEPANFDILTTLIDQIPIGEGEKSEDVFNKSVAFLRDSVFGLIAAGAGTVSASISWFFWLVSSNPRVEKSILEELRAASGAENRGAHGIFRIEELSKLPHLHGAVCESLRLYPAVPINPRASLQTDILPSGHIVGKNMRTLLVLYSVGRMEEVWGKDCLEFKPERWISEQGKILHVPSQKFAAFSAGPRTCLGKEMALNEFKMLAAAVLENYHVEMVKGHPIRPSSSVVLYMEHGLKVRLSKR